MRSGVLRKRWLPRGATLTAMLFLLVACAAASPSPSPSAQSSTVDLHGLAFGVAEITISPGDVSFVNQDAVPHLIAEGQNGTQVASPHFTKTNVAANQTATITFGAAGDYQITCLIHPTMNMVVHVH